MTTPKQPPVTQDDQQQGAPLAGTPASFLGEPVRLGEAGICQSITPVPVEPAAPIRKRRTKNWWRRSPAE